MSLPRRVVKVSSGIWGSVGRELLHPFLGTYRWYGASPDETVMVRVDSYVNPAPRAMRGHRSGMCCS